MSQDENRDRIILRQEILLPVGWTLTPSNGALQVAPPSLAPPPPVSAPAQPASLTAGDIEREIRKAVATILAQKTSPCGCHEKIAAASANIPVTNIDHFVSTPDGVVDISGGAIGSTGHSEADGNGPRRLCAQIFPGCSSGGGAIGSGFGEVCIEAPSGTLIDPDWEMAGIPVSGDPGPYTIVVTATFNDGTTVSDDRCFIGSVGSGSGLSAMRLPETTASSAAAELPPAHSYAVSVEETPGSVTSLVLKLDPYCTTPEQPIWRSPVGSGPSEWILKVGRHSQRLYAALIRRKAAAPDTVWLVDDFRVDSENTLSCETGSGRTAIVRPA